MATLPVPNDTEDFPALNTTQAPRAFSNPLLALVRMGLFFPATLLAMFVYALERTFGRLRSLPRDRAVALGMQRWARWSCAIMGVRTSVEGTPPAAGCYIAANHTGYGDIIALCAVTPCFFVPKAEMGSWPIVGPLLRWLGLPLVVRRRTQGLQDVAHRIEEVLGHEVSICVFLEGTSTGGDRVLPFRSSLLQPAFEARASVCPAAFVWGSDDARVDPTQDLAYWHPDDHVIGPHAWRFAGLRGKHCQVRFGDHQPFDATSDRKQLATRLHAEVSEMIDC